MRSQSDTRLRLHHGLLSICLIVLLCALPGEASLPTGHACRFWALIGTDYPSRLILEHLRDGRIESLRNLGGSNRDGWGIGFFLPPENSLSHYGPILRRGGPRANHPTDPDFDLAVTDLSRIRPRAAIGHVRAGTSGHWGIPNPHPFQHEGILFAHNGGVPEELLVEWLTDDDPDYLESHPPDYVEGYIDSELYFLYLLQFRHAHPELRHPEAMRRAVGKLGRAVDGRLNFVATAGDTLLALRYAPYDGADPVRYYPNLSESESSPYWIVASEIVGSESDNWGTIPSKTLAVFIPGRPPQFLAIEPQTNGEESIPAHIGKARPNPVRESIEIPIDLPPNDDRARMTIWDVQGRLIQDSFVSGSSGGVQDHLRWDGRDRDGLAVPSGTYYCRIIVGNETRTQTVSIVR